MTERVLVGVDGSERSLAALECALETFAGATVTALYVVECPDIVDSTSELERRIIADLRERADRTLQDARAVGEAHGVEISVAIAEDAPERGIIDFAVENDIDHIVVGSQGRTGTERLVLGSIAERVVRESPVPVTVVRERELSSASGSSLSGAEGGTYSSEGRMSSR